MTDYHSLIVEQSTDDLLTYLQTPDLFKGWIKAGSTGFLYSESGKGKSFITLYMAYCVAVGKDWMTGEFNRSPSNVLVIAAEGQQDYLVRKALLEEASKKKAPNLFVLPATPDLQDEAEVKKIKKALNELGSFSLIVVDTLSQTNSATESNEDLAAYLRSVEKLKTDKNTSLLIVHHSGYDTSRSRGGSALQANTDFRFRLEGCMPLVTLKAEKTKASALPEHIAFHLKTVTFEDPRFVNADGELVSSLVAEPLDPFELAGAEGVTLSTESIFNQLVEELDKRELVSMDHIKERLRYLGYTFSNSGFNYTKLATLIKGNSSKGNSYYKVDAIKEAVQEARNK